MTCALIAKPDSSCSAIKSVGGIKKRIYLGKRSEMLANGYTIDGSGNVTGINFATYKGLYRWFGKKLPGAGEQDLKAGNMKYLDQKFKFQMFANDPAVIAAINAALVVQDIVIIYETNFNTFRVIGKENGLDITSLKQTDGNAENTDNTYNVEFTGYETDLIPNFLVGDYNGTLATLDNYVIAG